MRAGTRTDELARAMATIRAIDPFDTQQREAAERILRFCGDHPDALHRSCSAGHLTASALVVDAAAESVLLIHHAKLGRWLQPGGHVDGSGDLADAALREATEETGIRGLQVIEPAIDLDIHHIPERGDEPAHEHLDVRFLVMAPAGAVVAINHESTDARWVGADDPDGLIESEELRRLVERGLAVAAGLAR